MMARNAKQMNKVWCLLAALKNISGRVNIF